jgi:hypothetical protein
VSRDPFELLKDRLVEASRPRRRLRPVWPLAAVLVLGTSAAAAMTLKAHKSAPVKTARYVVEVMPNLNTGAIGWCGSMTLRGVAGGHGCGSAGPPGSHLMAGGGLVSARSSKGVMFAVVDRQVATVVFGSRRVTPRDDPSVPPGWRVAVTSSGGENLVLLDENGHRLQENTFRGRDPRGVKVDPDDPPDARCAIRASKLPGLRAVSARLLTDIKTRPVISPAYLTCATTVYYLGKWRVRAAVVLNAADPDAPAPPLPPNRFVSARRAGPGWLVTFSAREQDREKVLRVLRVRP